MHKANQKEDFWQRCFELLPEKEHELFRTAQYSELKKTIRVNTLRNSIADFLTWQRKYHPDWMLKPHPFSDHLFLIDRENVEIPLGKTLGHQMGRFYIQEASSLLPPLALGNLFQKKVLDAAAAPGSKTTQLAALMEGGGLMVANEYSGNRSKILVYNLQKCAVPNAIITHYSADIFGKRLPGFFDRILLDAPCTGEGTVRKDKAALENWSLKRIMAAAGLQRQLITSAFEALAPGGIMVYSTCTLAPEENEAVVDSLLSEYADSAKPVDLKGLFVGAEKVPGISTFRGKRFLGGEKSLRIWPHIFNSEGFFIAAIKKKGESEIPTSGKHKLSRSKRIHESLILRRDQEIIISTLEREFGFALPRNYEFLSKDKQVWLLPCSGYDLIENIRADRPGILLGKLHGLQLRLSHEFCLAYGKEFVGERVYEIDRQSAIDYFAAKNLPLLQDLPKGDVVLRYLGIPIGLAKNTGSELKNNLPRNFVTENLY